MLNTLAFPKQTAAITAVALLSTMPGCTVYHMIVHEKATRNVMFTAPVPESGQCMIRTQNGQIRCETGDVAEIGVEARIEARAASAEKAEEFAEQITVDQSDNNGVLQIVANVPRGISGSVSLTVTLPYEMSLDLGTSNGAIDVSNLVGDIRADTSNGAIRLVDCLGAIDAKTSNGRLSVQGDSLLNVKARTSNGQVDLRGNLVSGNHEIRTSNGSIKVHLVGAPVSVIASTSNGKITANGKKMKKGQTFVMGQPDRSDGDSFVEPARLNLSTSNGGVSVTHEPAVVSDSTISVESLEQI